MPASGNEAARPTSLLTVASGACSWAIPSAAVGSVERLAIGAPTDAPDALGLLGLEARGEDEARRVLLLRAAGEQARVLVRGVIGLADAAPEQLLLLPRELAAAAPLISHVAVLAGKPALFVVSPERLLRASRDALSALNPNETEAARGNSC
jgi:hypothetical protein